MTLDSLKEWLASWGEGPNWSDASGATVPIGKEELRHLIAHAEKMREALRGLKTRVLSNAIGFREFAPATAASIAIVCEDAIEDV